MAFLSNFSHRMCRFCAWGLLSLILVVGLTVGDGAVKELAAAPLEMSVENSQQAHASALVEAGQSFYQVGRYAAAIESWQAAAEHFAASDDFLPQQITALNLLSSAYQAVAQWPEATAAIELSLDLLARSPQSAQLHAQAFSTQASLQLSLGQPERALERWEQSGEYYRQSEDTMGVLGSQINQAETLQSLGFYRRSRQQLETAHQQLVALPDSTVKVVGLRSLGKALQLIGDPRVSYDYMAEALAIARQIDATHELSSTYLSIGKLATEVASPGIALAYLEAAEAAATTVQDQVRAQLEQFSLYVKTQQYSIADAKALPLFEKLRRQPASRSTVYNIVNFTHYLSQLPTSPILTTNLNQLVAQGVQFSRDLKDTRAESHILRQMGHLYGSHHQFEAAFELTKKSLDAARSTRSADVISQSAWQLGRLLKQQQQTTAAVDVYSEAVAALQSLRGDLVAINQDIQFSYREQVEPVYREFISLLLDIKTPEALTQARDVLEALQVAELDNFFREACLDLQSNQIDQIDPTATVAYSIILPDRLATIYSRAGQPLQVFETPIEAKAAQETFREYLRLLHLSADRSKRLETSQKIYDWLVRPAEVSGLLTVDQPLVFVLDGVLRNIPMASLYDGQQYLLEKYPVALSPGLQLMQARSLDNRNINALVGGISEQRGPFSALPAVATEVSIIHQLVTSTKLLNSELTREALARRLRSESIDVVHLATHGQFSSDFNQTYFLTWDGVINIRELSEILRQREDEQNQAIELLTLSACETATGDDRAMLGLAGVAVRSGARATIATLWPIKDEVAAQLMTKFYQFLRQSDISKVEALRQAQVSLIRDTDFADPFFWSAYVLIGNWL